MKDYYLVLGVERDANNKEIKKAFRDSAKKCHPDVCDTTKTKKNFREVNEAYQVLGNSRTREEYDKNLSKSVPITTFSDHPFFRQNQDSTVQSTFQQNWSYPGEELLIKGSVLNCHIVLQQIQTLEDIEYPFTIDIQSRCPYCDDFFIGLVMFCPHCSNSRVMHQKKELIINIPKGVADNTRVCLSLEHVGLYDTKLVVTVRVI